MYASTATPGVFTHFDDTAPKVSTQEEKNYKLALAFTQKGKNLANDILGTDNVPITKPRDQIGGVTVVHHHHYHDDSWYFWGFRPVYVIDSGRGRRNDDDNTGARVLLGVVAMVVLGVAMYCIGDNIKTFREANKQIEEVKPYRFWTVIGSSKHDRETNMPFCKEIEKIAEHTNRIYSRIRFNAGWNFYTNVAIAAGSALALLGAIYAAQAYMAGGIMFTCGTAGVKLLGWGMDNTDTEHRRDAQAIRQSLDVLEVL